jgi:CheY-like chemotaxis protein
MQGLLSSWGHDVIVAGPAQKCLIAIAALPRRPDLILCDDRLRDGENGISAIKRLRSRYANLFRPS